jgi:hypothetical protein
MNRSQPLEGVGRRGVGDYQSLAGLPHGFAAVFAAGFAEAFAEGFAAGLLDFDSAFRGAGFVFFFAAVGIGSDLSSKMRGAASERAC